MKYIYFDYNTIRYHENKKLNLEKTLKSVNVNKYCIVYSPANIEEIIKNVREGEITQIEADITLDTIEKLTLSKALLPFKRNDLEQTEYNGIYLSEESPQAMYERLSPTYRENKAVTDHQAQKIRRGRDNVDFSRQKMSKPNKAKKILDDNNRDLQNFMRVYFLECISKPKYKGIPLDNFDIDKFSFDMYHNFFPIHEATIEKAFEILELHNVYPESDKHTSTYDVTHAIYGSYCDFVISNDKKFTNKANSIFEWYGVRTEIRRPKFFNKE